VTLAWVADSTVTAFTLEVAEEASADEAWALMMEAKAEPFCSRLTRLATGVLGLKKATQLALIWDAAEPPPDDAEGAADEGAAELAAELAGPLALADGLEPDDEPPLLPQAATVTASTASAATENTLTGRIRI
jgi:hypothetical protein